MYSDKEDYFPQKCPVELQERVTSDTKTPLLSAFIV